MEDLRNIEGTLDKETKDLIELSREMLRIARKMRVEKQEPATKEETPYEKVAKMNPYISNYNTVFYY